MKRDMLKELRGRANVVVDTSTQSPRTKGKLQAQFSQHQDNPFTINLVTFGYKSGSLWILIWL